MKDPTHEDLVRVLGPGAYTRIAEATGRSRQHIGRVLRGDGRGSIELIDQIAEFAGVPRRRIERYIEEGGSPNVALPALKYRRRSIPEIDCPEQGSRAKWNPLRRLIVGLEPDPEKPTSASAVRVRMGSHDEACRASECLHAGRRSRSNLLYHVVITTMVEGSKLSIWRKS